MRLSDLDGWARTHHGLATLASSGLSKDAWNRALRSGSLIPIHRHVARLPGTEPTKIQSIHAAVLAAGRGALASHQSAGVLWGLIDDEQVGDLVHLTLADRARRPRLDDVVIHRPTDVRRLTPQRRSGIACTNPLRTLCDLGAEEPELVGHAVGNALQQRLVDIDALTSTAAAHGQRGRPGTPALRAAIDSWAIDHRPADSVLEQVFLALVRRHGLPPVTFHERIEGWEVDFRFTGTAVIVECDGWSTHGLDRAQFERDRRRDNDLLAAGWQVVRLSYRAIVNDANDTAHRLRRTLARWADADAPDAR